MKTGITTKNFIEKLQEYEKDRGVGIINYIWKINSKYLINISDSDGHKKVIEVNSD